MSFDTVPPQAHSSITLDAVRELLATQAPQFAHLPIGEKFEGWDCAMFRLGDDLGVRLPRTEHAVRFLQAETHWVPRLSDAWEFPHPHFPFTGQPGAGYPWPWAIVSWLPGNMAIDVPLTAQAGPSVGRALAQVHVPAPPDAPFNIEQSIPMQARDLKVRERIVKVATLPGGELDVDAAVRVWDQALQAQEAHERVWSHGDLHGANVLSHGGEFGGIVDWGSMAACDPAVDVGFMHLLMPREGVHAAIEAYGQQTGRVDAHFIARTRGVGLAKSLGVVMSDREVTRAMGWRGLEALGVAHVSAVS